VITLEEMGIELDGIETALSLEAALEKLGVRPEIENRDDGENADREAEV
jgi:hypothetical protein